MEDFAKILVEVMKEGGSSSNETGSVSTRQGTDVLDAHMQKMQALVDSRSIVQLEKLGSRYLEKMRGSSKPNKRVNIGNGLYITGSSVDDDFDDTGENPTPSAAAIREGLDVYIRLHRESSNPEIRALAVDRALFTKLWQLTIGSFAQKAAFVKDLLAEYVKKDWTGIMFFTT